MNQNIVSYINDHKPVKRNSHIEVELRYKAGPELIKKFLIDSRDEFAENSEISKTVNLIYTLNDPAKPNYIETRNCATDELVKSTKHKKFSEARDFYTINISAEEEVSSKPANINEYVRLIRIKLRLTIELGPGRFDITQVATISDPSQMLKPIIDSTKATLFDRIEDNLTPVEKYDQFLANFNNPAITSIEMEYEFNENTDFEEKHFTADFAAELVGETVGVIFSQSRILRYIAHKVEPNKRIYSLKSLLNNAVSITKNDYNKIYPPIGWYITPKADGYSSLLILNMADKHYIYSEYATYFITISDRDINSIKSGLTVLVGELLPVKDYNFRFLCYDILIDDGSNLVDLQFRERLGKFSNLIGDSLEFINGDGAKTKVEAKNHILITNDIQVSLRMAETQVLDYETDGYILVSPNYSYQATKNYKIKDHHTIDFLVIEATPMMKKKNLLYSKENTFLLFCSITPAELEKAMITKIPEYTKLFPRVDQFGNNPIPIQFSPIDDPFAYIWNPDKKTATMLREEAKNGRLICELEWIGGEATPLKATSDNWSFIKIRDDRRNEPNYFGNNLLKTAEIEWLISKYPLKLKDMHLPVSTYFEKSKSDLYFAQTGAMRYMIFQIMQSLAKTGTKFAIDLASGQGQDLGKYYRLGYDRLICVDIDSTALAELVSRRFAIIRNIKKNYKMNIKILHRDLNEPADDTLELFQPLLDEQQVGVIICNLAIHYMIDMPKKLANFVKLILGLTKSGTHFMFTCMSGRAVLDLIGPNKEWKYHQNNILKYHIVKKFNETTLAEHGQIIQTKLPFSNELYEEALVNIEYVNSVFTKFGFKVVSSSSICDFLPVMKKENPNVANMLTPEDIQYLGLYHYTILIRV